MDNGAGDIADPGIAIFYEGKLGDDRGFRFQTVISRECSARELSMLMDKLRSEANRQDAFYALDKLNGQIEADTNTLHKFRTEMKKISEGYVRNWRDRGKKGDPELSSSEKDSMNKLEIDIRNLEGAIKRAMDKRDTAQAKIDGRLN
jgi:hypothetical protein